MRTNNFKAVVEPDEDFDGNPSVWHAYCPALEQHGASTWAATETEALKNIDDLVRMVVESMLEHGERIPEEPSDAGRPDQSGATAARPPELPCLWP